MKYFRFFFFVASFFIVATPNHAQDAASWVRQLYAHRTDTVSLIFMGDIMVHGAQLTSAQTQQGHSFLHCFEAIAPRLANADLSIANIETTFAGPPYTGYPIFSTPDVLISDLKTSGVQLLFTANNHICDQGKKGLQRSLNLFDSIGIFHTGTFRSPKERNQRYPLLITLKGIRIAFLCYSYGTNGFSIPNPFVVNLIDTIAISKDILKAQRMQPDFIIASMHWGDEYRIKQSAAQEALAAFLFKKGVDIIMGAHPHVPQGMEVTYHATGEIQHIVAYSLGNVISNMTLPHTQIGLLTEIKLIKNGLYKAIASFDYEWIATEQRRNQGVRKFHVLPLAQCRNNSASVTILPDSTVRPSLRFRLDTIAGTRRTLSFQLQPNK